MTFAEKIKNLRKKNGLTQLELCKAFGVSERTFRGWENENRYPKKHDLYMQLAQLLDCDVSYLISETDLSLSRMISHRLCETSSCYMRSAMTSSIGNGKHFQEFNLFDMTNRAMEYEANLFAAQIALPDDEILDYIDRGYDAGTIARAMNSDINLVALTVSELIRQGYGLRPLEHRNDFLK